MATETNKRRFSIKMQMAIIFGALIIAGFSLLIVLTIRRARASVMGEVTAHLIDKANDTATILDGEILQWFRYLDGVALQKELHDPDVTYLEKAKFLNELAKKERNAGVEGIVSFSFIDRKAQSIWQMVLTLMYHTKSGLVHLKAVKRSISRSLF